LRLAVRIRGSPQKSSAAQVLIAAVGTTWRHETLEGNIVGAVFSDLELWVSCSHPFPTLKNTPKSLNGRRPSPIMSPICLLLI